MREEDYRRYVLINLPHARTIAQRVGRTLEVLGAFGEAGNGGALGLHAAFEGLEGALRDFDEDPKAEEAVAAADRVADKARSLVDAILGTPCRSDRLGQHVRNLFECLGLAEEGAELSLKCGERPDSPMR
ncbi:MAG TPA: hypothetical protein VIC87_07655 [Vicinamibacteria bacterium]|jgi:hypothetical protein